jgi:hypothetical protein
MLFEINSKKSTVSAKSCVPVLHFILIWHKKLGNSKYSAHKLAYVAKAITGLGTASTED